MQECFRWENSTSGLVRLSPMSFDKLAVQFRGCITLGSLRQQLPISCFAKRT